MAAQERTGRSGVAAIGVAQEYQNVFLATQREGCNGIPWFAFTKADRRVSCFYFYLWDVDFGAYADRSTMPRTAGSRLVMP